MSGSLEESPADIIRQLLIDLSMGTASGTWPIYSFWEPDTPDNCITIYHTAGDLVASHQIDGEVQEYHGFQVRVRSSTPEVGFTKARAIAVSMDSMIQDAVVIGANVYLIYSIVRKTDVIPIGKETPTSFRDVFTINAVACLRQTS